MALDLLIESSYGILNYSVEAFSSLQKVLIAEEVCANARSFLFCGEFLETHRFASLCGPGDKPTDKNSSFIWNLN